ncbi:Ubiquitin-conjugating enzyme E2 15 [Dissophora ornata]|nr:Ubiquitin-conjugating enzyme E2 15 [Dissophora ornata]
MSSQSVLLLKRQLKELTKNPVEGFSAGLVDDDNIYEGGFFRAIMTFPLDYPVMPPKLKFTTEMYHPNVYPSGEVCISILHPPGEDKYGYEQASERWSPVHTVETILVSVISMLSSPNDESPANIEAAKELRENYPSFKKKVQRLARRTAEEF